MLVTTKGRYALIALCDLAQHQDAGPVPLKEIAERQQLSDKYLESILKALVRAGYLAGTRGKGGGYRLTVSPEQLSVLDVLEEVETDLGVVEGIDQDETAGLQAGPQVRLLDMWRELDALVRGYLADKTVAELASAVDPGDYYVI